MSFFIILKALSNKIIKFRFIGTLKAIILVENESNLARVGALLVLITALYGHDLYVVVNAALANKKYYYTY